MVGLLGLASGGWLPGARELLAATATSLSTLHGSFMKMKMNVCMYMYMFYGTPCEQIMYSGAILIRAHVCVLINKVSCVTF